MYVDAWSVGLRDDSSAGHSADFFELGLIHGDLLGLRECDLADLSEDAQDAVLLAGTLLLAYLDEARRLPQA